MKLIRRRRPSLKTALGITKVKRNIARTTGIPTTKSGRKRKFLNTITGGLFGKYERPRADVNRPFKFLKQATSGCLVSVLGSITILILLILSLF